MKICLLIWGWLICSGTFNIDKGICINILQIRTVWVNAKYFHTVRIKHCTSGQKQHITEEQHQFIGIFESLDVVHQKKIRSVWAWVAPLLLYPSENKNTKMSTVFGIPVAQFVSTITQTRIPKEECKIQVTLNDSNFSQITDICGCCICGCCITPPGWG